MSVSAPSVEAPVAARIPGLAFACGFVGLAVGAAVLSGVLPIQFAIATVFLFAGPHNWFEARYALGRLPARTGKLWGFFLLSAVGIVGLTIAYAAIPPLLAVVSDPALMYAAWSTVFLFWIAVLIWMRSRTNPRFDGGWVWPLACLICAGVWLNPMVLPVALVYLHPLMALWLLDRELARSRPAWRRAYWCALACIPLLLGLLWWQLRDAPPLTGTDSFTLAFSPELTSKSADTLADHSGAWFLTGVSTHFLVAAHTFLEMVHYGVWVVLIPLIGMRSWPWELKTIPAARRNRAWARGVSALLIFGALIVGVLWVCFGLDYATTRHVYFTVAMLHVLAEVPFLLRMV
ncbi:MAG: hypothetical protein L0241_21135 [Planctomycetia bacterium]|nr:hypothetical protein [Planctomycetia bacterium]